MSWRLLKSGGGLDIRLCFARWIRPKPPTIRQSNKGTRCSILDRRTYSSALLPQKLVKRARLNRKDLTPHLQGDLPSIRQFSSEKQHAKGRTSTTKGRRLISVALVIYTACGFLYYYEDKSGRETPFTRLLKRVVYGKPLNEHTFVPFNVIAKDQITRNSFILTIRPQASSGERGWLTSQPKLSLQDEPIRYILLAGLHALFPMFGQDRHGSRAVLEQAWDHGMWSVEIKQPQLQIARDYTPLPPLNGKGEKELETGDLRFLIRQYDGGEVSTYLSRLSVGDKVELRGPHLGFDVVKRLGDAEQIVFLAGGTGIAPALQLAYTVSRKKGPTEFPNISILWANRRREDCLACRGIHSSGDLQGGSPGPIMRQWLEMQQRLPNLSIRCTVDEERNFIREDDVMLPSLRKGSVHEKSVASSTDCPYHSQSVIERCTNGDDPVQSVCSCPAHGGGRIGKNLVMVSGPDGFIQAYAGPKRWAGGHELQAQLGGVLGKLKARYPDVFSDWIVLKL